MDRPRLPVTRGLGYGLMIGAVLGAGAWASSALIDYGRNKERVVTAKLLAAADSAKAADVERAKRAAIDSTVRAGAVRIKNADDRAKRAELATNAALELANQARDDATRVLEDTAATNAQLRGSLGNVLGAFPAVTDSLKLERQAHVNALRERDSTHARNLRVQLEGFDAVVAAKNTAYTSLQKSISPQIDAAYGRGKNRGVLYTLAGVGAIAITIVVVAR